MYACTRLALHENLSSVTKDVGADDSVRPMRSREFLQYSVGADALIGPHGSYEFAADFRINGAICRVDATPAG